MKDFFHGFVMILVTIITAVVVFPLVPLWMFAIWFTHDDSDIIDAAVDAFDSYLKIIHIE